MVHFEGVMKTLVQCDFDGTITEKDVSFILLDAFADGDWRQLDRDYREGRISVGRFNADVFAMVKANRDTLLEVAKDKAKIRPGFPEVVACCRRKGFRLVIVSNGLDFYIDEIFKDMGVAGIEVHAAETRFHTDGLRVQYIGPDGNPLDEDVKGAYVNSFLREGYRLIYAGDGISDTSPARRCHHIFATGDLLAHCKRTRLGCIPFTDFNEITRVLELW